MTIRVIAAVVDTKQLRLYKEDGSTVDIPQGDPRLAQLLEQCKPLSNPKAFRLPVNGSGQAYVEVQFEVPEKVRENAFGDYEKKTGGLTKFFRVVKTKISHLFGDGQVDDTPVAHVAPTQLGELPTLELDTPVPAPETPKMDAAIADIMAHAEPVSSETFDDNDTTENHTIVAVTDNGRGKAVAVPGVEALKGHVAHAAKLGNTKGMEAFLKRLGAAISQRGHSVQDVLKFMERGDLPLTDDGCIIAYKVLRSTSKVDNSPLGQGIFVDCHTGKVEQRVGSFVTQSIDLIRQDKAQCGTGLHIARRAYLRSFGGDIIVMVKIKPEDVIVVPNGEPDKMRVRGYHILAKIPKDEHIKLRSNQEMTGTNALKLLTMAIAGDHIDVIEIIEITSPSGGSFTRTPVETSKNYVPQVKKDTPKTVPVSAPVKKPDPVLDAPKVDPKAVAKEVEAKKAEAPKTKAQEARELYIAGKYVELKAFKKAAKKGYDKLGFTPEEEDLIVGSTGNSPVTNGQPAVKSTPAAPAKEKTPNKKTRAAIKEVRDGKAQKTGTVAQTMKELNKPTPKKKETKPVATPAPTLTGTRAEVARTLFDQAVAGDKSRWGTLWRHQKDCKKSWKILGFTDREIERIKVNKPDHI